MPNRIRILFINCPTLATDAASFLILAQNKVQTIFQFEIHHFWIYSRKSQGPLGGWRNSKLEIIQGRYERFVPWLVRKYRTLLDLRAAPDFRNYFDEDSWIVPAKQAVDSYDHWVSNRQANHFDSIPAPTILITETNFRDHYISFCGNDIAVISIAEWKQFFKPASALEFILTSVQRLSLRLWYGPAIGSHYPTRGCLWDYAINVPDVKISSFLGYLCETCRTALRHSLGPTEYREIIQLIENKWTGDSESASSVAGVLAKIYKYDLSRSTGLNPGIIRFILGFMRAEIGRATIDILKWVVILLITIALASCFPSIVKFLTR